MPKTTSQKRSLSSTDRLERELNRLLAAQRKQLQDENVVRLEPNGDISYERTRTVPVGQAASLSNEPAPADHDTDAAPNNFPQTPDSSKNGNIFAPETPNPTTEAATGEAPQPQPDPSLAPTGCNSAPATTDAADDPISFHEPAIAGKEFVGATAGSPSSAADSPCATAGLPSSAAPDTADPLEELLARALARPRRGRPTAFDERNKGQLVALLSLGMSLRQAASVLGVSHTTIRNTLQADATLAEEITAARFQAQLQPLACVIREARRSWKAATWLLKYLDHKIATHEETPDEYRARRQRETDEFFARPFPGSKKK